jgi:TolB-like protein
MKRCPECRRDYYDDSLSYCLDDGAALLEGPTSLSVSDEAATAIMFSGDLGQALSRETPVSSEAPLRSIAVLPFAHLSSHPDDEYFCEGLAEELLNALTRIGDLKVAARTSAFSFKGKGANVAEIGRALGVETVLEGSVRKSGTRLRVTVQLVDTADGYHIWSERYDREMSDIFDIQDDITLAVVEALKFKLLGHERSAILRKGTESSEAFELYLRGRAHWNSRTHAGFLKAIENFERAIEIDPDYALAYAALADCYSFHAYFGASAPADVAPKARVAADKATSLDAGFAECRTSNAAVRLFFDYDFEGAESEYLAAIAINPQFLPAHYLYCAVLTAQGRFDEAITEGRIAVDIDPLSPHANTQLARALLCAGRLDEAVERTKKLLEVMPDFYHLHWILGWASGKTERWDLAVEHFQNAAATGGLMFYSFLGNALVNAGRADEAGALLDELNEESKRRFVPPISAAVLEGALGNVQRGLDLLDECREMQIPTVIWVGVDPIFDVFRSEPRFHELKARIGLSA